jgi:hypothetical protein
MAKAKNTRHPRLVHPCPGPDPFRELKERMNDGGVGTRTYRVVSLIGLHFALFRPNGGKIPHTVLARQLGLDRRDVHEIVLAWAAVVYNHLIRKDREDETALAAPTAAPGCLPGQSAAGSGRKELPALEIVPAPEGGQIPSSPTSCPHGQSANATAPRLCEVEPLSPSGTPGQICELPPSYIFKEHSSFDLQIRAFSALFEGDRGWFCQNAPGAEHATWAVSKLDYWTRYEGALTVHFLGKRRLSVFPISRDPQTYERVRFAALDLDGEDRLAEALKLVGRMEKLGLAPFLERSFSGGFHIWLFFNKWQHAGNVKRFFDRLLHEEGVVAETRPSTNELGKHEGPGQKAIALPYFGDGGPKGDQCRMIDPFTLAPLPVHAFLESISYSEDVPRLEVIRTGAQPPRFANTIHLSNEPHIDQLVASWPPVAKGEHHLSENGKPKFGRDDAALGHAGELGAIGIFGEDAFEYLSRWNRTNRPPLSDRALLTKIHYVAKKNGVDFSAGRSA